MAFSKLFIDRPILAGVISVLVMLVGAVAYLRLPVSQYPEVAPPTITVTTSYPGANAETVAAAVAAPLEQEINGVEGMLYLSSQSTSDGRVTVTVTFALGTDLDDAQVLVQNRVNIALPRLPEDVRRLGVVTLKNSPDILMVVHIYSPDDSRDQLYLSNYTLLNIRDRLARLDGVGDLRLFGAREYSMRIWLDPHRIASLGMTAGEVVQALRGQNVQVAGGVLDRPPSTKQGAYEVSVQLLGRLTDPAQFGDVLLKSGADGRLVRVRDISRIELGAVDYSTNAYLDDKPAVAVPVFQRPGSNALATAQRVQALMADLRSEFPPGLDYDIIYNPSEFIAESVAEVQTTLYEASLLVVVVVVLFLQSWRASLIPLLAIPVSLIGTYAVLQAFGFSLNALSLFGLVLAIGIVVDDAIVVVENAERNLHEGMTPREAAHHTMDEVGGALVAIALVLSAVFVPTAFIPGISGQFYRQFALTIASATIISCIVSLTLSPALAAVLLRPRTQQSRSRAGRIVAPFFSGFNTVFDRISELYGRGVGRLVRVSALVLVAYGGLIALTGLQFWRAPGGFIPAQDQGYFITAVQLPPGSSLARTDAVVQRVIKDLLAIPGVEHTASFSGFDAASFTNASNAAAVFFTVTPFDEREAHGVDAATVLQNARQRLSAIAEASIIVIAPPAVRGISSTGGFKFIVQDRSSHGLPALRDAAMSVVAAAWQEPGLTSVFSQFEVSTPQLYVDIDRARAQALGVPPSRVFEALEVFLGSAFVNDFNYLGRTYRVTAQADSQFRRDARNISELRTRSDDGGMVPLGSVATFRRRERSDAGDALQPLPSRRDPRRCRPWHFVRSGHEYDGSAGRTHAARGILLRVDRVGLPTAASGEHGGLRVCVCRTGRLSRARRPVRKRDAAAGGRAHCPHVSACSDHRRAAPRTGQQYPHPNRPRRAGRTRVQERDPDRRVCEAGRRSARAQPIRRCSARGTRATPSDPHDIVRIHSRRRAAGGRRWCRRRSTPGDRDRRVRRDARCHVIRSAVHTRVLCHLQTPCTRRTAARKSRSAS